MKVNEKDGQSTYSPFEVAELLTWLEGLDLGDLFWLKHTYAKILEAKVAVENHRATDKELN